MLVRKIKNSYGIILSFIVSISLLGAPLAGAQDNSAGRYRPDGREIAREVAGMFGETLFEVRTYDPAPQVDAFSAATIFYPLTLSFAPPIGAVVLMPGYGATSDAYAWWGPMLASFGYAVMIVDTNDLKDSLEARKNALIAAVEFVQAENHQEDSPIAGKIDTDKIAIMGHSLGGGASLQAAEQLGETIRAVISLTPYCCELGQSFTGNFGSLGVPTMIVASAEDSVAPPEQHSWALYQSVADSTAKLYLEFETGEHNLPTNDGEDLATLGRYSVAWLKLQVDHESSFSETIFGAQDDEYAGKFSRYESTR